MCACLHLGLLRHVRLRQWAQGEPAALEDDSVGAEAARTHCPSQSSRSTAPHQGRTSGLGVTAEDDFPAKSSVMEGSTRPAAARTKGMGADDTTASVSPAKHQTTVSNHSPPHTGLPWITALMEAFNMNSGQGLQP